MRYPPFPGSAEREWARHGNSAVLSYIAAGIEVNPEIGIERMGQ